MSRENGRGYNSEKEELKDAFHSFSSPVKANGKVAEILDASALPNERKRVKDALTIYVGMLAGIKGKNRAVDQSMAQLGKADTEVLRSREDLASAQTFGEYGIVAIHQVGTMIHFEKKLEDVQRTIHKSPIDLQAPYLKEFLELLSFDRAGVLDIKIGPHHFA